MDVTYLETLAQDFTDRLATLEEKIFTLVGHRFAVTSPKQLSVVLFEELKLGETDGFRRRRKTTGFSTAFQTLEKLQVYHPVILPIIEYRELAKLLSTYVLPLPNLLGSDRRLHTHYAPDAASGRLSSKKPNLQNIPIRTELGRQIRRAFIAAPGHQLLAADYSQIELRVIAHLAGDPAMIHVFQTGGDIHAATSAALGINRRTAKAVNFGVLYGLTAYGLADSLGISREEAQGFIDRYLGAYPGVAAYLDELIKRARDCGYAVTLFGKQRPLPELASGNEFLRRAAERVAINHPIQGTAAELMKLAMITLDRAFGDRLDAEMLLQLHDELIFGVDARHVPTLAEEIETHMVGVYPLAVPLAVQSKTGANWADMVPVLAFDK